MSKIVKSCLAIAVTCGALGLSGTFAQDSEPASDLAPLSFTAAQAIGGGANYQRSCAMCHGAQLEGLSAPGLAGPNFSWRDRPVSEFHDYVQDLMPLDAPGSLSDAQVATIIAFIAQGNGMEAGSEPMPTASEDLEGVKFGQ